MSKRNAILAAATHLFSKNGLQQTSMADLRKKTGAASGTIFHHFKNKEDLFLNVLENCRNDIVTAFKNHQAHTQYSTGMDMLEGILACYLHLTVDLKDQFLLLHRHYPYQMAEANSVCRHCLESIYTYLLNIFEKAICCGIDDHSIQSSSPRNSAMILFAMVDGIARLNTYNIYHADSLYQDMVLSCRKMLGPTKTHKELMI